MHRLEIALILTAVLITGASTGYIAAVSIDDSTTEPTDNSPEVEVEDVELTENKHLAKITINVNGYEEQYVHPVEPDDEHNSAEVELDAHQQIDTTGDDYALAADVCHIQPHVNEWNDDQHVTIHINDEHAHEWTTDDEYTTDDYVVIRANWNDRVTVTDSEGDEILSGTVTPTVDDPDPYLNSGLYHVDGDIECTLDD